MCGESYNGFSRLASAKCLASAEGREHLHRVDRAVVDPDLEVRMGAGRITGRSDEADQLSALDHATLLDGKREEVGVERLEPGVVLDDDVVAVADQRTGAIGHSTGELHDTVGGGK